MIKLICSISIPSNNFLSANYYQSNKETLQRKACERYQILSIEERKKSNNMVVNDTKFYLKMDKKACWV